MVAQPDSTADDRSGREESPAASTEAPLSDELVAAAADGIERLNEGVPEAGGRPAVHALLDRAEAALGSPAAAEIEFVGPLSAIDPDLGAWSPRRRLALFVGFNGLCWALILLPVLL